VTTEAILQGLEADGKNYEGLYVDMNDKEQRKYVKAGATLINDLLKTLDRARIDKSRSYKVSVEAEAKSIRERLEAANLPYTMLIEAHKHERAEILAAEKAKADAEALALQIESDHEHAILMDKVETIEKAEREREKAVALERMVEQLAEARIRQDREHKAQIARNLEAARLKREADKAHVGEVRTAAKESLMAIGMDEMIAKAVVMAIHKGQIANVTISY
jgi:hypothetical protein